MGQRKEVHNHINVYPYYVMSHRTIFVKLVLTKYLNFIKICQLPKLGSLKNIQYVRCGKVSSNKKKATFTNKKVQKPKTNFASVLCLTHNFEKIKATELTYSIGES